MIFEISPRDNIADCTAPYPSPLSFWGMLIYGNTTDQASEHRKAGKEGEREREFGKRDQTLQLSRRGCSYLHRKSTYVDVEIGFHRWRAHIHTHTHARGKLQIGVKAARYPAAPRYRSIKLISASQRAGMRKFSSGRLSFARDWITPDGNGTVFGREKWANAVELTRVSVRVSPR